MKSTGMSWQDIVKLCHNTDCPKSLPRKGLGRWGPGAAALSPYVATTYDDLEILWKYLGFVLMFFLDIDDKYSILKE